MFEELLISVLFIIVLIILCIISNLYSKKEEEKEKNKRRQEYEELHTLSGRISTYKLDEYEIGDWEKIVRKKMKPIVKINNKYQTNKKINVLIGDYDKMSVSNSVCVLESMGIDVTIAKSAIEIMERLNKGEKYDLIITNNIYDRGNCDGPQLLYELRECNIKIPIIVLTVSHNKRAEFLNEGFNEYMTKLLDQVKVLNMMSKVLPDIIFEKIN